MTVRALVRRVGVVVTMASVFLAVGGCSRSESAAPPKPRPTRIVIDGRSRMVDGKVVCLNGPTGEVNIEVKPADTAEGPESAVPIVVLDLTPADDAPSVSLLTINLSDIGLSTGRYRQRGTPTATKNGDIYTVRGEGSVAGTPREAQIYKSFELELSCPAH